MTRSRMPVSHYVRAAAPESATQLLRRGACPECQRPIRREPNDPDCGGRTVSVCGSDACGWNDFDAQQEAHYIECHRDDLDL